MTQNDPQGLTCRKTPTQSILISSMSSHNICFHGEIRKISVLFKLIITPYLELSSCVKRSKVKQTSPTCMYTIFTLLFCQYIKVNRGCGNTMPNLPNLSHFPEDKWEISIYLSWDKDFRAVAKKNIQIMIYIFLISRRKRMLWYSLEAPHQSEVLHMLWYSLEAPHHSDVLHVVLIRSTSPRWGFICCGTQKQLTMVRCFICCGTH